MLFRHPSYVIATVFALFLLVPAYAAENRVALVIGNAKYPSAPLRNPVNDARDMAVALRKLGFEVIERVDATQREMNRAITQFGEKLNAESIALFFYAGHGIQVRGKNYLIPIDAQIASDISVRSETVDVDALLEQLSVSSLNVVILDACRNNPFERRFRSTGGGLAQMEAPKGTLIAYSTAPGKVASDGAGRNSLYTHELLKHIQTPGLPLEAVFKRVRATVSQSTNDQQIPWEASSLTGEFYFSRQASFAEPTASSTRPESSEHELAYWKSILNSTEPRDFNEFLRRYPEGEFAPAARSRLNQLALQQKRAPVEDASRFGDATGPCPNGFAGKWETNFGKVELKVEGNKVNGVFPSYNGTIIGSISGRTMTGTWHEPGILFGGSGDLRFELSMDGRSFSGTCTRKTGIGGNCGTWNGECIQ